MYSNNFVQGLVLSKQLNYFKIFFIETSTFLWRYAYCVSALKSLNVRNTFVRKVLLLRQALILLIKYKKKNCPAECGLYQSGSKSNQTEPLFDLLK